MTVLRTVSRCVRCARLVRSESRVETVLAVLLAVVTFGPEVYARVVD